MRGAARPRQLMKDIATDGVLHRLYNIHSFVREVAVQEIVSYIQAYDVRLTRP